MFLPFFIAAPSLGKLGLAAAPVNFTKRQFGLTVAWRKVGSRQIGLSTRAPFGTVCKSKFTSIFIDKQGRPALAREAASGSFRAAGTTLNRIEAVSLASPDVRTSTKEGLRSQTVKSRFVVRSCANGLVERRRPLLHSSLLIRERRRSMAGELNVAVPGGSKGRHTRRGAMLPPGISRNGFRRAPVEGVDLAALAHALHSDVIPALVKRHQAASNGRANGHRALPWVPTTAGDVTELARLVVGADDGMAETFVERLRHGGVPAEVVCRDVLEPAARELGDLWSSDDLDFTQVTIGVWRLQRLARGFDAGSAAVAGPLAQRRVLLAPMPGEQHSFGLYTVGACFRRAGWMVVSDVPLAPAALAQLVREEWFAVVGFSVGSERQLDAVRSIVRAVRAASRNPAVGVLVGGPVLRQRPALVHEVGADLTARDGPEAVRQATRFLNTGVRT